MTEQPIVLRDFAGSIQITPQAEARKAELIAKAKEVSEVASTQQQELSVAAERNLKNLRTELESSRKLIKGPVLELGRQIDDTAAAFIADAEKEEKRLQGLTAHYQRKLLDEQRAAEAKAEQERQRIAKEAEDARKATEQAEKLRIEAEQAQARAEALKGQQKLKAEQEAARLKAEAEKLDAEAFERALNAETAPEPIVATPEKVHGLSVKPKIAWRLAGLNIYQQTKSILSLCGSHPELFVGIKDPETEQITGLRLDKRLINERLNGTGPELKPTPELETYEDIRTSVR